MANNEKVIRNVLRFIGLTGNYKGFPGMITAVDMVLENEELLHSATTVLYPTVAEKHGTTSTRLQRNFRTLINICWQEENRERLYNIAGRNLTQCPTAVEFIEMLSNYIQFNYPA